MRLLRLQILALIPSGLMFAQAEFRPTVPKTWDEAAFREFEAPLARREASARHISRELADAKALEAAAAEERAPPEASPA